MLDFYRLAGVAGEVEGVDQSKAGREDANRHRFEHQEIQAIQGQVERRILFLRHLGVMGEDGHGGISALDEKLESLT